MEFELASRVSAGVHMAEEGLTSKQRSSSQVQVRVLLLLVWKTWPCIYMDRKRGLATDAVVVDVASALLDEGLL